METNFALVLFVDKPLKTDSKCYKMKALHPHNSSIKSNAFSVI